MKGVELYGRVRYAVQIEGLSQREAGAAVWDRPSDDFQDDGVLGAAGLLAKQAADAPEAGPVHRDHRPDS